MAVKFKLVERRNLGEDAATAPRKVYAQAVHSGYVTFEELHKEIADNSTLTSADVKAVLDRMNSFLNKHLSAGRIVQFGELGNFRMAVGSKGAVDEKSFTTSLIKKPKVVFTPGSQLRTTRTLATFEKETEKEAPECDKEHVL